ncbi:BT4734/BF3469 family protein [uncultured Rikenella sp.]|uniref:BT4734/BF3469 family protein n=1 Tax=uncultured Rikenella sp. TaxID=368003 RepID=UPI00260EC11E|nr:BT4734/BF3469 family protein [uncultured Rikenella sp.]
MKHVLDVEVSYFQDYYDKIPKRVNLYEQLCSWKQYNREIDRLRQETNPDLRAHIKSNLPCITPSGTFSARRNNGLKKHSRLICIDIDAKDNPQITDWERFKVRLSKLPWVAFAALSVSGQGVFLLVPIRYPKRHQEHFEAILRFFAGKGFRIDSSCRNMSRLRGCTYDPEPYVNLEAEPFAQWCKLPTVEQRKSDPVKTNRNVESLVAKIERTGTDITERYAQWFRLGCALASEFGEAGRDYFHRISRQNHRQYNRQECDTQYTKCLATDRITIATFFHLCKCCGITLK